MTAVLVTKFKSSQGSWEADVTYSDGGREVLACVHKYFFKRDAASFYYDDPWTPDLRESTKFAKHVELIRSKGRVILTTDDVEESSGRRRVFQTDRLRRRLPHQRFCHRRGRHALSLRKSDPASLSLAVPVLLARCSHSIISSSTQFSAQKPTFQQCF